MNKQTMIEKEYSLLIKHVNDTPFLHCPNCGGKLTPRLLHVHHLPGGLSVLLRSPSSHWPSASWIHAGPRSLMWRWAAHAAATAAGPGSISP
jgi:hypothetical protein